MHTVGVEPTIKTAPVAMCAIKKHNKNYAINKNTIIIVNKAIASVNAKPKIA